MEPAPESRPAGAADAAASASNKEPPLLLYVVQVDTRHKESTSICGYKETTAPADFFEKLVETHPRTVCHQSSVAASCGLNIKLYFTKYREGLAPSYRQGGAQGVMNRFQEPGILAENNGAATYLTVDPITGYAEYITTGRVYVVQDDGKTPLSKAKVWGLVEMVNCLMDTFEMDPSSMARGRKKLTRWSDQYKQGTWDPPSGSSGMDLYANRTTSTKATSAPAPPPAPAPATTTRRDDERRPVQDQGLGQEMDPVMWRTFFEVCVNHLFKALAADLYPNAENELIFGIEMGSGPSNHATLRTMPKGQLVYCVWKEIRSHNIESTLKTIDEDESNSMVWNAFYRAAEEEFGNVIVDSIMNEKLGECFRQWTAEVCNDPECHLKAYSREMHRRCLEASQQELPWLVNSECVEHCNWMDRVRVANRGAVTASTANDTTST